jgi:hypothetical protein
MILHWTMMMMIVVHFHGPQKERETAFLSNCPSTDVPKACVVLESRLVDGSITTRASRFSRKELGTRDFTDDTKQSSEMHIDRSDSTANEGNIKTIQSCIFIMFRMVLRQPLQMASSSVVYVPKENRLRRLVHASARHCVPIFAFSSQAPMQR